MNGPGRVRAYEPLSQREQDLARQIVDAAFAVHTTLGPGLLESIYETCLCHELTKRGLPHRRQVVVPILYDGILFDEGLRLDILVDDIVICEVKAADGMHPIFMAQALTQLKLTGKRLGLLINFDVPLLKDGIKRVIL